MKLKSAFLVAAVASAFSVSAQAQTVFSDNFDSYTPTILNWNPPPASGWTVTDGTVDLIGGIPPAFDFLPGNGNYIDLDGSTGNSGVFANSVNLTGGTTYTLSFDLAGSHRTSTEFVSVNFGTSSTSFSPLSGDPFSIRTLNFTPGSTGLYTFSFENRGGDNVGALLDNVSVTAVPEPESYAMIMAGLGLMGFIVRRRKNGQV